MQYAYAVESGAGTNLKVGVHARKKIFVVPLHFVYSSSSVQRFGERFPGGQYSLVCCVSTHGAPRAQPFLKVGARVPRALWSRRRWLLNMERNEASHGRDMNARPNPKSETVAKP